MIHVTVLDFNNNMLFEHVHEQLFEDIIEWYKTQCDIDIRGYAKRNGIWKILFESEEDFSLFKLQFGNILQISKYDPNDNYAKTLKVVGYERV